MLYWLNPFTLAETSSVIGGNGSCFLYIPMYFSIPVKAQGSIAGCVVGFDHGSASVFAYWVPRAIFFTRHRRPWSNPIIAGLLIDFFPYLFTWIWILMLWNGWFLLTSWLLGNSHCCYGLVAKGHRWIIVMKTLIPALPDYKWRLVE